MSHAEIRLPDQLEPGVYANSINIWHTPSEFTLDFLTAPLDIELPDTARVVSRVKIPTSFVFELLHGLNDNMTEYERKYGEIRRVDEGEDDE